MIAATENELKKLFNTIIDIGRYTEYSSGSQPGANGALSGTRDIKLGAAGHECERKFWEIPQRKFWKNHLRLETKTFFFFFFAQLNLDSKMDSILVRTLFFEITSNLTEKLPQSG